MIKFEVKYHAPDLEMMLHAAAIEAFQELLTNQVGAMRCAEHGEAPTIIIEGEGVERLTATVKGCCDTFVEQVVAAIDEVPPAGN